MSEDLKPRGKVIKTITDSVPLKNGELQAAKVKIGFSAGAGTFHIALPKYVGEFIGERDSEYGYDKPFDRRENEVRAVTLDGVVGAYKNLCSWYRELVKDAIRQKKIVVTFNANRPGSSQFANPMQYSTISFATSPALALSYEVQWQIHDSLYRVYERPGELPQMSYVQKMPDDGPTRRSSGGRSLFVLDWTEEREAFFEDMQTNMTRLIDLVASMLLGDTTANVDRMIAGGGLLSLPAPEDVRSPDNVEPS